MTSYYVIVWTCTDFTSRAFVHGNILLGAQKHGIFSNPPRGPAVPRSFWLRSGRLIGAYNIYHWHFDIASLAGAEGAGRRLVGRRRSRAMTNRILVLFKMALNHGSRLAQENAETGNNNKDTHQDVIACVHAWKDNDDMAGNRVLDSGLRTQDSRWLPVHPIHGISTRAKQD